MKHAPVRRILALIFALALALPLPPLAPCAGQAAAQPVSLVYFPNWNIYADPAAQAKNLPWDRLDAVLHAFWKIVPSGGGYTIASTDPRADTDDSNPKAHFAQYRQCVKAHPNVQILLSIGGWTCSDLFSPMAATEAGRASFIESCVDTLRRYPFLSGLDLDWEYPGVPRRASGGDPGNPASPQDRENYTLLLRELRAALDAAFGKGKKQLTVCAGASEGILQHQDYAALFPFVDRIHLMTYDLADMASGATGHHAPLLGAVSADSAVKYLLNQGVPAAKIAVGAPLYSHGWRLTYADTDPLGAPATALKSGGTKLWKALSALERVAVPPGTPGWHAGYDEKSQAAYLWNDDPASPSYRHFYSYESEASLDAKLQYIRVHSLGGLIVWQSGGDDAAAGFPMLTRIYHALHP